MENQVRVESNIQSTIYSFLYYKVNVNVPGNKDTIVLHPGSTHLHIGLSTSPTPHTIPHLIAYKRTVPPAPKGGEGVASEGDGGKGRTYRDSSLILQHSNPITVGID